MSSPASMSHDRLRNAQSDIAFLQREHKQVLQQLHKEIETLQQKCSDLQFTVSSLTLSAASTDALRSELDSARSVSSAKDKRIAELETGLAVSTERANDLEWTRVDLENRLASREARVEELERRAATAADVAKLQEECRRRFDTQLSESSKRMEEVSERARTPSVAAVTKKAGDVVDPDAGAGADIRVLRRIASTPSSRRSKVFRHSLGGGGGQVDERAQRLPLDYRQAVATLPHIMTDVAAVGRRKSVKSTEQDLSELESKALGESFA